MRIRQETGLPIDDLVAIQASKLEWQESLERPRLLVPALCIAVSAGFGFLLAVFLLCH